MANGAELIIRILVDNASAASDLDETASRFDRFESSMGRLAGPAAAVTGALAGLGVAAVSAASDTQQAMGAVESVFGSAADSVIGFAEDAATAVGLSKSDYLELAAVAGAAFQNMGLSAQDAAAQTDQLIGIGADLAATFGGSTADAVDALQAAFRGEADPAEKFGLNLKQSAINAKLAELGLDGLTGAAAESARQQAIMALIMEQTSEVQGQFAAEADTLAGSQQIANAEFANAASTLGTTLLPAVTAVTQMFTGMANWVAQNSTVVMILAGVVGALAVGILAINGALAVYRAAQTVATAVTWAFNAAWLASPITWIIVGIAAIVAGIILLWKNCEGFRNIVTAVWNAMRAGAIAAWNAIKSAISAVINWGKSAITSLRTTVTGAWNTVRNGASTAWNGVRSVVSSVISSVTGFLTRVRSTATGVWSAIRNTGSTAWNGIRGVVSGVVNTITSTVTRIRSTATGVFNTVRSVATGAMNAILSPVRALQSAFNSVVGAVRSLISWIGRIKIPEINLPFGIGSSSAAMAAPSIASAMSASAPSPLMAGARAGGLVGALARLRGPQLTGGSLTVINVRGTLNDTDSARAVRRVLRNDSRRRGGVVIGAT